MYISAVSVRWQHCIDHAVNKQMPEKRPDGLLGVIPQPTDSRLSETNAVNVTARAALPPE